MKIVVFLVFLDHLIIYLSFKNALGPLPFQKIQDLSVLDTGTSLKQMTEYLIIWCVNSKLWN